MTDMRPQAHKSLVSHGSKQFFLVCEVLVQIGGAIIDEFCDITHTQRIWSPSLNDLLCCLNNRFARPCLTAFACLSFYHFPNSYRLLNIVRHYYRRKKAVCQGVVKEQKIV